MSAHPVLEAIDTRLVRLRLVAEAGQREIDALQKAHDELEDALAGAIVHDVEELQRLLGSDSVEEEPAAPSSPPPPAPDSSPPSGPAPSLGLDACVEAVLEGLRELPAGDAYSTPQIADECRDLVGSQVRRGLAEAAERGKVERVGKGRWTRWRLQEKRTPATPPAEKRPRGNGQPTVEGKICGYLQLHPKEPARKIALGVGVSLNEIRPVLTRLMREGEVRAGHKDGDTVYSWIG